MYKELIHVDRCLYWQSLEVARLFRGARVPFCTHSHDIFYVSTPVRIQMFWLL